MDSVVNVDHAVTVVGKWIIYYNCEKFLPLNSDSFNTTCDYSDEEYYISNVQKVYYAVRSFNPKKS